MSGPRASETVPCWLDTGGGWSFVSEALADRLGLETQGTRRVDGAEARIVAASRAALGGRTVDLSATPTAVASPTMFDRTGAQAFLPAKVLGAHHVVFDHPGRAFTLADPGRVDPQGIPVETPVDPSSKFPRIEVDVDGRTIGLLLDTGASHTMVSQALFDEWTDTHPEWRVVDAALGTANMAAVGADSHRRMLRIPELRIGDVTIEHVSVVTRPTGTFEEWMSSTMTAPIVGALGGNVLSHLRVEIDYAGERTYLSPDHVVLPTVWVAPFVLAKASDGIRVLEVLPGRDVDPTIVGARIVAIDGAEAGSSFATVAERLTDDRPGGRQLTLESADGVRDLDVELVEI